MAKTISNICDKMLLALLSYVLVMDNLQLIKPLLDHKNEQILEKIDTDFGNITSVDQALFYYIILL